MIQSFQTADGQELLLQELKPADQLSLYLFFQGLSPLSQSRFAPHASDYKTITTICSGDDPNTLRYIIRATGADPIIAYFLVHQGLFPWEALRFQEAGKDFSAEACCLLAPAVADRWQGRGIGTIVFPFIASILQQKGIREILLWGGVQSGNEPALRYYRKLGFREFNRFYYEGKENLDMVKSISG